jgi:outer membrane biosynthesis protein TonB
MTLSEDQRALLRLLAGREEGYEDIAALKGKSVEEVRAEVKDALAQMQAEEEKGTPAPPPPVPPLPPVEEPVVPPRPPEPEPKPDPEPPAPAPQAATPPPPSKARRTGSARRPWPQIPAERRRLVLLTGGALALVAVVLGAIAIFSGGSDSSAPEANSATAENAAVAQNGKVTQAILEPADGSNAGGQAVFGRVGKEEIVLQVTAENLKPTDNGQSYTVWLYRSPKLSLRVGSVAVGSSGRLGARFVIPAELLAYVAGGAFDQIYLSRTENAAYQAEVARAKKNKTLPRYTGETVLTGEITGPVAKAGKEGG